MAGSFDTGIPKSLFTKARCVVIIPGVKKAALGSAANMDAATSPAGSIADGARRARHPG